jgi:hypothetical protein
MIYFNEIYSHWHEFDMLHWDLSDFKEQDVYEYSYNS